MAKIEDLINMDYNVFVNLTRKENIDELKKIIKQMANVANKRIWNLTKNPIGKYSPAYQSLKESGKTKFSVKGITAATSQDTNKLVHEYQQLKKFLSAKTSTISGWNSVRREVAKRTGSSKLFNVDYKSDRSAKIWINREKKFWKLYNRLVDNYGGIITQLDSDRIQKMLAKVERTRSLSKDDNLVADIMNKYIEKLYESSESGEMFDDREFAKEFKIKF